MDKPFFCPRCGHQLSPYKEWCDTCFQKKIRLRAEAHDKQERNKRERGIDKVRNQWYSENPVINNQIPND